MQWRRVETHTDQTPYGSLLFEPLLFVLLLELLDRAPDPLALLGTPGPGLDHRRNIQAIILQMCKFCDLSCGGDSKHAASIITGFPAGTGLFSWHHGMDRGPYRF